MRSRFATAARLVGDRQPLTIGHAGFFSTQIEQMSEVNIVDAPVWTVCHLFANAAAGSSARLP